MAAAAEKDTGQLSYPYGRASSDEEILSGVLNALHHNTGVPQDVIKVEVHDGRATLSGVVDQEFERDLAQKAAETAPGVVEVTNLITIAS